MHRPATAGVAAILHRARSVRAGHAASAAVPRRLQGVRARRRIFHHAGPGPVCMASQPQLEQTVVEAVPVLRPVAPTTARNDIQDVQIADGVTLLRCKLADRHEMARSCCPPIVHSDALCFRVSFSIFFQLN